MNLAPAVQPSGIASVCVEGLRYPIRVPSATDPGGQPTIATIAVNAMIRDEFRAEWLDSFVHVLHNRRDDIAWESLSDIATNFQDAFGAWSVSISLSFPYFVEKHAPVSGEPALSCYECSYAVRSSFESSETMVTLAVVVPALTSHDPAVFDSGHEDLLDRSDFRIAIESRETIFPELLISLVEQNTLGGLYSHLGRSDSVAIMTSARSRRVTALDALSGIRESLERVMPVDSYDVSCTTSCILHPYATLLTIHGETQRVSHALSEGPI